VIDPNEKADYLAAAISNYIGGEFGPTRITAILVMCGFTASQISDFIVEHRDAAFAAMVERNRKPVKNEIPPYRTDLSGKPR
jgi:hypothetical protein